MASARRPPRLKTAKDAPQEQGSLFADPAGTLPPRPVKPRAGWRMPDLQGSTVAEMRVRWIRRLTPAQVARVERELGRLPLMLSKLGFGPVEVERSFVRRRKS